MAGLNAKLPRALDQVEPPEPAGEGCTPSLRVQREGANCPREEQGLPGVGRHSPPDLHDEAVDFLAPK